MPSVAIMAGKKLGFQKKVLGVILDFQKF